VQEKDIDTNFHSTEQQRDSNESGISKRIQNRDEYDGSAPRFDSLESPKGGEFDAELRIFENSFSNAVSDSGVETDFQPPSKSVARSSLRLKYEAEVSSLKKRIGSLESMRLELGLSQRKMCQLLLVDPSAWSRWTKSGADAPPHIYRMLQWYLAVQEKYPALDIQFWLSNLTRTTESHGWEANISKLSQSIASLKAERDRMTEALKSLEARLLLSESGISRQTSRWAEVKVEPTIESSRGKTRVDFWWLLPVTTLIAFALGAGFVLFTINVIK